MTAKNAFRAQPDATYKTVFAYGFLGVMRATGVEPALVADQQTERMLVDGDQLDCDVIQHALGLACRTGCRPFGLDLSSVGRFSV